jgi:hypothetical protein
VACSRLGQQLKVYWPEEHARVEGVIDDHDQIDDDVHLYHIVYQDGNEQVKNGTKVAPNHLRPHASLCFVAVIH